jgi:hypothetical protein
LIAPKEKPVTGNSEPVIALRPVRITLELIDATHGGATAIAHSGLDQHDGTRIIRVGLCATHILVNRSLHRADTFAIRFLIGLSLVEFTIFWWHSGDGRGVTAALRAAAGYAPDENAWGSGFASRLANSELLRSVDTLPIFGASPKSGRHPIGEFQAVLRHPSDIPRWRIASADGSPVAKKPKVKPAPEAGRIAEITPAPVKTPTFAEVFIQCCKETLDAATLTALTELTRERLTT